METAGPFSAVSLKQLTAPERDFLFDVHFVDLQKFQPLARFKVQKFAELTKFVLGSSV